MKYTVESDLWNFQAWSGGKDTLDDLKEKGDCEAVEELIDELFGDDIPSDTEVNDFLWFERDAIAEHLGYRDYDAYMNGWSLSDLEDAENWWTDEAEPDVKEKLSGKAREDFEDEDDWWDAVDEWWESLEEEKKVDIYYQES